MKDIQEKEIQYFIELLKSVLLSYEPPEKSEDISFENLYILAKSHGLANMIYYAISKLKNKPEMRLLKIWQRDYMLGLLRDSTQARELEVILKNFNENQIKNVVLKGFELKALYPRSDMRQMGDLDILVSSSDKDKIKDIMLNLGYEETEYNSEREITYKKKPLMNVEIHTSLFDRDSKYYVPFEKMSKMENVEKKEESSYKFSREDSYIYNFVHIVLHFSCRGIGVRSVIDHWLYSQNEELDWEYINKTLKDLELYDFFKNFLQLGDVWFGTGKNNKLTRELGEYIINSGLYGNFENYGTVKLSKNGRIKSIFLLLFPSIKFMQEKFPILKGKVYLLPIYYVIRWLKLLEIQGIKNIKQVLKSIVFTNRKKLEKRKKFYKDIGLTR